MFVCDARWSFSDGGYKEFEYKPPYPASLLCPDSPNQVSLRNNVTYTYPQPGNLATTYIYPQPGIPSIHLHNDEDQ